MISKDMTSKKPLYIQLKNTIIQQIEEKKLLPGDRLLSEAQFQKEFHISRVTVRKAIDELISEGYLTRIHGKGTFVKQNEQSMQRTLSLTDVCRIQGKSLSSEVLFADLVHVTEELSKSFPAKQLIKIERIRKIDGVAIMLETCFFPEQYSFLLGQDLTGSLYHILEEQGIKPEYKGMNQVTISELNTTQSKLFNVQEGISVIHHKGTVYGSNNQLILATDELVRVDLPDLFKYYL